MSIYKFVEKPAPIEEIKNYIVYKIHQDLVTDRVKNVIRKYKDHLYVFNELNHPEVFNSGIYRVRGWIIDFREFQKTFWIKEKYCGIREISSFSKMFIRKNCTCPENIIKIVEIYNKKDKI